MSVFRDEACGQTGGYDLPIIHAFHKFRRYLNCEAHEWEYLRYASSDRFEYFEFINGCI
jgi:hypothetical protein